MDNPWHLRDAKSCMLKTLLRVFTNSLMEVAALGKLLGTSNLYCLTKPVLNYRGICLRFAILAFFFSSMSRQNP